MNLRAIVNACTQNVNPNQTVTWVRSTGYTINEYFQQVPASVSVQIEAQVQALSGSDLQQTDALNIQGTMRKVYLYGNIQAISRPEAIGGDLLLFPETPNGEIKTWLVSLVSETWPDWCSVIVTLQNDD